MTFSSLTRYNASLKLQGICVHGKSIQAAVWCKEKEQLLSVGGKVKFRRGGLFSCSVLSFFSLMCLTSFLSAREHGLHSGFP